MRFPGTPSHRLVDDGDEHDLAAWMLELVDQSPDRLAFITIPRPIDTDDELDAIEERMRLAYDLLKAEHPDLGVKFLEPIPELPGSGDTALVVVLHEHRWIGGRCVNGCSEQRPVDGGGGEG